MSYSDQCGVAAGVLRGARRACPQSPLSEDQIKKYLEILHSYTKNISDEPKMQPPCSNCENSENFAIYQGYKICEECGITNGHVLGYFDLKDCDRLYFRKKSIYQRKYYYEKKIKQIPNLTQDQKDELYQKLVRINDEAVKQVNKDFKRKRMINIFYIINKFLEEMKLNIIKINISNKTQDYYNKWWRSYLEKLD